VTLAQLGTFALSHSNGTKIRFQGPYQTNRLNLRYNLRTHHRGKNDLESGIACRRLAMLTENRHTVCNLSAHMRMYACIFVETTVIGVVKYAT
jgi:hypothetical protein